MAINCCNLKNTETYGHIALAGSVALTATAVSLFFSMNLAFLPTALLGCAGGGCFVLAVVLYTCSCLKVEEQQQPDGGITPRTPREKNVEIYKDTQKICRDQKYETENGPVKFSNKTVLETTQVYKSVNAIPDNRPHIKTQFNVVEKDSFVAAAEVPFSGRVPLVLNMANATTPGGGVLNGAFAQEEALFRRSNLSVGLQKIADEQNGNYEIPEEGGIYSDGVVVFKTPDGQLMDSLQMCAIASVAAYNLNGEDAGMGRASLAAGTKRKIRNMLRMAYHQGHKDLVLGALGCGAFGNPPDVIARYFSAVLTEDEFAQAFNSVTFAVYVSEHNRERDAANLAAFEKQFPKG